MLNINDLVLAKRLTATVKEQTKGLEHGHCPMLEQVSEPTAMLLRYWFSTDHCDLRSINYHDGQRQALLNVIYAHEVLGIQSLKELYEKQAPDVLLGSLKTLESLSAVKYNYPKYCLKMATGTGKTWVLQSLLVWQLLNANHDPSSRRYTRYFLLVAPGLIVYDRLLDAFQGKERTDGTRDFKTSDLYQYQELFIPPAFRESVFSFAQSCICPKSEIGLKITANGLIAVTNWHLLNEGNAGNAEDVTADESDEWIAPGVDIDPSAVVKSLLPLSPGKSSGNDLNELNRRFEAGSVLEYLRSLPSLLVFNDEAHHIHEFKKAGEVTEVEWQKSLNQLAASKTNRFIQIDFSATPYNEVGAGKNAIKTYFPHIVVDFDLKTAMREGLVKSLVLDRSVRNEFHDQASLDFKAERDEENNPTLSEGQKLMLRAGLTKLERLSADFATLTPVGQTDHRHPKMLIVCEDTTVTPLVENFFIDNGIVESELLRVDSNRKGELKPDEWQSLRQRLFNLDNQRSPRIIISVLMLREGFDVNNICVIVPLRTSSAGILLEQTIGRGLRLMWRGEEFASHKQENRKLIHNGQSPNSLIDVLSIIEHPMFIHFYEELMAEGLVTEVDETEQANQSSVGDLVTVPLRPDFEAFDIGIPVIIREKEEEIHLHDIDPAILSPFDSFSFETLKAMGGEGVRFYSEDVQSKTTFGDYSVKSGILTASGYNEYLQRLVKRVTEAATLPGLTKSSKEYAHKSKFPLLQVHRPELVAKIDDYLRTYLFNQPINLSDGDDWRVLLFEAVSEHVVKVWSQAIYQAQHAEVIEEAEVHTNWLSQVQSFTVRSSFAIDVHKSIYPKLPFPSHSGGLEKFFIEVCNRDSSVDAFCKVLEHQHDFVRFPYLREDGQMSRYVPDFLVRCGDAHFIVETKSQDNISHPNVKRKQSAVLDWCARINDLGPADSGGSLWYYAIVGEDFFKSRVEYGETIEEILKHSALRKADFKQLLF
jgi:type III restriction enzyme